MTLHVRSLTRSRFLRGITMILSPSLSSLVATELGLLKHNASLMPFIFLDSYSLMVLAYQRCFSVHISMHMALHVRSLTRSRFLKGIVATTELSFLKHNAHVFHFLILSYVYGPPISPVLFSSYFSSHSFICQIFDQK